MTKASPNIAIVPAPLKIVPAEPTPGLSIVAAYNEMRRLWDENTLLQETCCYLGSVHPESALLNDAYEAIEQHNDQRIAALETLIETSLAGDARDALIQLGLLHTELQAHEWTEPADPNAYKRFFMMVESIARVLSDLGGVDRASLGQCWEEGRRRPHSKVEA